MKKRLLVTVSMILGLPMSFSICQEDKVTNSTPFAIVAYAGHTLGGTFCNCGAPGCICEPGEQPGGNMTIAPSSQPKSDQVTEPNTLDSTSDFDFGSGALMLALAIWVFFRLRA
jgi:hypothetical protein